MRSFRTVDFDRLRPPSSPSRLAHVHKHHRRAATLLTTKRPLTDAERGKLLGIVFVLAEHARVLEGRLARCDRAIVRARRRASGRGVFRV